jgi:hypothetical protein
MGERICAVQGCGRVAPSNRRGWCSVHYSRYLTKGDPQAPMVWDSTVTTEDRFWSKVDAGDCWQWTDSLATNGYGAFRTPSGSVRAHRWAYEHLVGPIPDGLQLDHLCRNRGCVNPDHLEPVTLGENVRRGAAGAHLRARTHCPQGHEYTPENTYVRAGNRRRCRECDRAACRANYYKRRAKVMGL